MREGGKGAMVAWILIAALGLPAMVLLARFAWRMLTSVFRGPPLMFVDRTASGRLWGKCPRCGARVDLEETEPGVTSFTCASCGEKGTW
jgi:hypothetical protein